MGPLEVHVQRLLERVAGANVQAVANTGVLVSIPDLSLPEGWNKQSTTVHFFAPQGYPFARPDCFWADDDLRLASGAVPQNAAVNNPMPGLGKSALWFSWHLQTWNASRDDLTSWLASIKDRLARAV